MLLSSFFFVLDIVDLLDNKPDSPEFIVVLKKILKDDKISQAYWAYVSVDCSTRASLQ